MTDVAVRSVENGFTRRDELYLEEAQKGRTPEQIAKKYGVPPTTVALRIKQMLRAQDFFTDYERKQMLLNSAYAFKDKLDSGIDIVLENHQMANVYLKMLDTLSKMLKDMGEISERELAIITEAQSSAIIGAVERGFYSVRTYLRDNHPEVDLLELDLQFRSAVQAGLIPQNDKEDDEE